MKIITFSYPNIPITEEKIALCLGYFDGVHLGHQRIIQKALDEGYKVGILTLDSSPAFILGRIKENHNLTSLADRADYFEKLGGKGTKVKTISDTVYGISFLLERDTKTVLIAINDLVATGYKGKRLWKSQEQEA